jgi:TRAP-type C4-dicarboxylate transport system permease small subunit
LLDVMGRKFLNNSIPGSLELTEVLMVIVIFGALPLVSWRGEHVVFDSLDPFIPAWLRGIQTSIVHLICAGVFGFLARLLLMRADRFAEYSDTTVYLKIPLTPVAWLMASLLAIVAAVHLLFVFVRPASGHVGTQEPGAAS